MHRPPSPPPAGPCRIARGLRLRAAFALAWLALGSLTARAQWIDQSVRLEAGWNAVYLHVDPSHVSLDTLVGNNPGNPILEIWMWAPNPTAAQFVTSPQALTSASSQWRVWNRSSSGVDTLTHLSGNAAFLVRTSTAFDWTLRGRPVGPDYSWSSAGLNLIGFNSPPGSAAPSFDTLFSPAPDLNVSAELFAYRGGELSANPVPLLDKTLARATRGQAFWVRAAAVSPYFGPFEVAFASPQGARFEDTRGQVSFRLKNHTSQPLTVSLARIASESAPSGQPAVRGPLPLLVRGPINTTTLTYSHSNLTTTPFSWNLTPKGAEGSDIEVVLGLDRSAMGGNPGELFASVLRFTDSLGHSQVDVPASAQPASRVGLWAGSAIVSSVSHSLNRYATLASTNSLTNLLASLGLAEGTNGFHYEVDSATRRVLVYGGPQSKTGSWLLAGVPKTDDGTVARPYPLRLLIHNDGTQHRLLQRVFYGLDPATNAILATREARLDPTQLANARRISAVHLPFSSNNIPWTCSGSLAQGATLTTTINVAHDDHASNPFLHTYHPDHDNLNATFDAALDAGGESYGIRRTITLAVTPATADFESLTRAAAALQGSYTEVVTFLGKFGPTREFTARGTFVLQRLSDIATLAQ